MAGEERRREDVSVGERAASEHFRGDVGFV